MLYNIKKQFEKRGNDMKIVDKAFEAMQNAYAPYSKYKVGACVETTDGKYCGGGSAIFAAYSNGYRKKHIKAIAIVSKGEKLVTPCGACRQVLSELIEKDAEIILSNGEKTLITNIDDLMPLAFGAKNL